MSVIPFLDQQTFFITGSTGLVGKVMILKLLMYAPHSKIYLLVRGKKDLNARDRFDKEILSESPIFDDFLKENPNAVNNIRVFNGDIAEEGLGMSEEDLDLCRENVTCILHIAATVTFNEPLEIAMAVNVLGTKRVLDLAKETKNLVSFVHISTAYVNSIRITSDEVKDKVYPTDMDVYQIIDQCMAMDPLDLERETPKIIGDHPNTYTFSKSLAEYILLEEKGDLPVCILRPSMITGSKEFPIIGWVDSFIGPAGLVLAYGLGAVHTMYADKNCKPDFIPVDFVVHETLVAAWYTAQNPPGKRLPVYHACAGKNNPLTWHFVRSLAGGYFRRNPAKKSISYPFTLMIKNGILFWVSHQVFHVFPALLRDSQRLIAGKRTKMLKASSQIYRIILSLSFFCINQFSFSLKKHNNSI